MYFLSLLVYINSGDWKQTKEEGQTHIFYYPLKGSTLSPPPSHTSKMSSSIIFRIPPPPFKFYYLLMAVNWNKRNGFLLTEYCSRLKYFLLPSLFKLLLFVLMLNVQYRSPHSNIFICTNWFTNFCYAWHQDLNWHLALHTCTMYMYIVFLKFNLVTKVFHD